MFNQIRYQIARVIAPTTATRRFDAAAGGRRWDSRPSFGNIGAETLAAAATIRARARHAYANNPHASAGVNAFVTGLIGAGITPASAHPDAEARRIAGMAFKAWAGRADADGLTDFFGLQAAVAQALIVDGESFVQLIVGDDGLSLRIIPAEFVDEGMTRDLGNGACIVAGVEFDSSGRRVAYHVRPHAPTDVFASFATPIRVPAADMLHVFRPIGPGQVRGISWLAPVLLKLNEIDQLSDALLVGFKTSAMFAGFLKDVNGTSGSEPFEGTQAGSILESGLEPGTLKFLPQGYDLTFATPQQAQQSGDFMSAELRSVAAGLGVPDHLLTGDLRNANYSSIRASMVAFRQRLEQLQYHTLIPQLVRPVFERAVTMLVYSGAIDSADFESTKSDWLAAEYYPPAQQWVDPQKDAAATAEMIAGGLMSRRQAVASLGYSIEDVDAEIAADRARESTLGLTFIAPAKVESNANA